VPVFVAAGMPIQGVILLEVVETIPDVFATVANVTGQMSATTILSRRSEVAVEPVRSA
jgi:proton glutamate symport protein